MGIDFCKTSSGQRIAIDLGFDADMTEREMKSLALQLNHFFLKSFCKSQFPHKSVNSFSISVIVKDRLTNLWGS